MHIYGYMSANHMMKELRLRIVVKEIEVQESCMEQRSCVRLLRMLLSILAWILLLISTLYQIAGKWGNNGSDIPLLWYTCMSQCQGRAFHTDGFVLISTFLKWKYYDCHVLSIYTYTLYVYI